MGQPIMTSNPDFVLRMAEEQDAGTILDFIKGLAEYEKLPNEVVATEEILHDSLFVRHAAEVVIGEYQGAPVAFALFFHNFSTFQGLPGLYLEDLFVKPEMRGKGFGTIMLTFLASLAKKRKCGRFEWICLDWNEPSLKFYRQMGAVPMDGWTIQRVEQAALDKLAEQFDQRQG